MGEGLGLGAQGERRGGQRADKCEAQAEEEQAKDSENRQRSSLVPRMRQYDDVIHSSDKISGIILWMRKPRLSEAKSLVQGRACN